MFSLLFPLPLFISRLRASSVDSVLLRALSGLTLSSYIINNVNSWGGGGCLSDVLERGEKNQIDE